MRKGGRWFIECVVLQKTCTLDTHSGNQRYISEGREDIPQRVKAKKFIGYVTGYTEKEKPPVKR